MTDKKTEALKLELEKAYLAGFNASGEGYNGEYPFGDENQNPEDNPMWVKDRDNAIREALAEQPAQQQEPVAVTYKEVWGAMNALYAGDIKQVQIALEMENKKLYTSPQPAPATELREQREPDIDYCPTCAVLSKDFLEPDLSVRPAQMGQEPVAYMGANKTQREERMIKLIECATCGYPLTPEERTTLVEVNGKMQKPWVGLTEIEADKIKGMEVSMDVSTGEDDAHHRIYGRVYEVILEDGEGTPNAILAIEDDRNFTSPPASKPLTDEQIDNTTRKQVDDLLDHIYEYGTAAEGIDFRVRAIARAIEAKLKEKNS